MVSTADAVAAIYDKFVTAWGVTTPIAADSQHFNPPSNDEFVRLAVRHTVSNQESLGGVGTRKYDRQGFVIVQIFTPLNVGVKTALTLADQAREIFEGTRITGIDMRFNDCQIQELGPLDGWYQVNVQTEFAYSEVK